MKKNSEKYNLSTKIARYEKIRELVEPGKSLTSVLDGQTGDQFMKTGNNLEDERSGGKVQIKLPKHYDPQNFY